MSLGRKVSSNRAERAARDVERRRRDRYAMKNAATDPNARVSGRSVGGEMIRSYGTNLDGTPESRANRVRLADLQNTNAALGNQSARLGNQAQANRNAATALDANGLTAPQRGAKLADVLNTITPDARNAGHNTLSRVLGAGRNDVTGRTVEGGAGRDYFLQTGQAAPGANLRDVMQAEQRNMERGSGVAVTESGRVIRADPNYEYGIQRQIADPSLRRLIPQIAQANAQAQENPRQRALLAQVMEMTKQGARLPKNADLDNLTDRDVVTMASAAGQSAAQKEYSRDYQKLAQTFSRLKIPGTDPTTGMAMERPPTPEEIDAQVKSVIGERPGGDEIDRMLDEIGGGKGTPPPQMMMTRDRRPAERPLLAQVTGAEPAPAPPGRDASLAEIYRNPAPGPTAGAAGDVPAVEEAMNLEGFQPRPFLAPDPIEWAVEYAPNPLGAPRPFVIIDGKREFLTPEEFALYRRQKTPRQRAWKDLLENGPRYEGSAADYGMRG